MIDLKSIKNNDFYGLLYLAYTDKTDEFWNEHIFCLDSLQENLAVEICRSWAKENASSFEELLDDEPASTLRCIAYLIYRKDADTDIENYLHNIDKAFSHDLMRICGNTVDALMQEYRITK